MKANRFLLVMILATLISSSLSVFGAYAGGQGQLRIEPHAFDDPDPTVLSSPATFNVSVVEHTAEDPHILIVISEGCYDGLDGNLITVTWNWDPYLTPVGFGQGDFTWIKKGVVPPEDEFPSKLYQAKSLRSHLWNYSAPEDEGIYYAYAPIPVPDIKEGEVYEFTVDVPSTTVRALVYAFGDGIKVPPTRPGFIIPEVPFGIVMTIAAMVAALALSKSRVQIITR